MSGNPPSPGAPGPDNDADESVIAAMFEMIRRDAQANLDDIEEPSAAELEAMDELDDLDMIEPRLDGTAKLAALGELDDLDAIEPSPDQSPDMAPALALLAQAEEPEVLSLDTLDDAEETEAPADDLDDVEELLDDVESLIEDYIDADLDDDELDDEGYDLDDDDISSYHDLYGEDDTIVPSFREGEFAEEEDGDTDYYNEIR